MRLKCVETLYVDVASVCVLETPADFKLSRLSCYKNRYLRSFHYVFGHFNTNLFLIDISILFSVNCLKSIEKDEFGGLLSIPSEFVTDIIQLMILFWYILRNPKLFSICFHVEKFIQGQCLKFTTTSDGSDVIFAYNFSRFLLASTS